jgi:hypothetical protein
MATISEMMSYVKEVSVKSPDFFRLYKAVSSKYWTFEKPDMLQQCASLLVKFAERGDEQEIILSAKIIEQVFTMRKEKKDSTKIRLGFKDGTEFQVDIYTDGIARDQLEDMLSKAGKAMDSGNFTVGDKRK